MILITRAARISTNTASGSGEEIGEKIENYALFKQRHVPNNSIHKGSFTIIDIYESVHSVRF